MANEGLQVHCDEKTGPVCSVRLYGRELLDKERPCESELFVNGQPLKLRKHTDPNDPTRKLTHLKGEHFVNQFAGWALVLARVMGGRPNLKHNCFGIQTLVRRELCDQTCPCPGPGGPTVEAPLWVDTLGVLNWNWKFWGGDTRMIFCSAHPTGPDDEFGHVGYEHDTPEKCKRFMQNVYRRIYPGSLVVHGGVFYSAKTQHWLAITCRQPQVGYILNIEQAGRGVGYDFTLHAQLGVGATLQLPEIKLYYGRTHDEMMRWLGDYATFYYEEPPEWVFKTLWGEGLAWNNQPTWTKQAEHWEKRLDSGELSGIGYCLVTNRPVMSGTTPLGYEPDPNHGTLAEFRSMCHRIAGRGVPLLVWMSHSGLLYGGGRDIDDDWFIRGIDGRICASWGSIDQGGLTQINPGHPGYIEYTKKWIRFYVRECRCKGIFLDCLAWAFPPDFRPRSFMRYPGDTNLMAVKFAREVYACLKECDPDGILLGEGTSMDFPINVFAVNSNPTRAIDGLGPRDFLLQLNQWAPKRLVIDQGPRLFPAAGYCHMDERPGSEKRNRYMVELLRAKGGRDAFIPLPGDLSILDDLLIVSVPNPPVPRDIKLPEAWKRVTRLVGETGEPTVRRDRRGLFRKVQPGIYRMSQSVQPLRYSR